jgi:hypothetical protein
VQENSYLEAQAFVAWAFFFDINILVSDEQIRALLKEHRRVLRSRTKRFAAAGLEPATYGL